MILPMAFTHQRKKGDMPKPSADNQTVRNTFFKKNCKHFSKSIGKKMESHQEVFLEVFQHCPRHPKLGGSAGLSPASISPTRAFAWKPPPWSGVLSHTRGSDSLLLPPQLAYKKKKIGGGKKKPPQHLSATIVSAAAAGARWQRVDGNEIEIG